MPILDWDDTTTGAEPLHVTDLERFEHFSNGYLIHDPYHPGFIGDFRYAMLPNTVAPLWGVNFGGAEPGRHLSSSASDGCLQRPEPASGISGWGAHR